MACTIASSARTRSGPISPSRTVRVRHARAGCRAAQAAAFSHGTTRRPAATTPPAADSRNSPTAFQNEKSSPPAAAAATVNKVSAVASFSRPSPWISVIRLPGRPTLRPTARAATGSGGATAAPSATPTASVAPDTQRSKPRPMSSAVTSTSDTDRLITVRRLRRMSSSEDSRAALYSSGGMTQVRIRCESRVTLGPGRNAYAIPTRVSNAAAGSPVLPATQRTATTTATTARTK